MRGGVCFGGLILTLLVVPAWSDGRTEGIAGWAETPPTGVGGHTVEAVPVAATAPVSGTGAEVFQGDFACREPLGDAQAGPTVCLSRVNPGLAQFFFDLRWHLDPESGERVVTGISIRQEGRAEPFQVIASLDARTATQIDNAGFELIDMDFDGYLDMRLIAGGTAGPNVLYRHWLWLVQEERFMESPALDEIVSPEFDSETREIFSRWRSSAAEGGVDVYTWSGDVPVMIHREVDRFDGSSHCVRIFFDRIDGEIRETGSGSCI